MQSDQPHQIIWVTVGGILLLAMVGGMIAYFQSAYHPSPALFWFLVAVGALGFYAVAAPFLGFWLPRTRSEPLWRRRHTVRSAPAAVSGVSIAAQALVNSERGRISGERVDILSENLLNAGSIQAGSDSRLRQRCAELGRRINDDIGDYHRESTSLTYDGFARRARSPQDPGQFWKDGKESSKLADALMDRFRRLYQGEALALFDEALARGWVKAEERFWFELPTNPIGVSKVATHLATWGARQ